MKDASIIGKTVTVRGYLAKDKTCAPDCLVNGRDVVLDNEKRFLAPPPGPAVPPIAPPVAPALPARPDAAPPPLPPT